MLQYEGIDVSKVIDINKTNGPNECDIFHYWYFLNKGLKFEACVCHGCHDLMQKAKNVNDVAIVLLKQTITDFIFGR